MNIARIARNLIAGGVRPKDTSGEQIYISEEYALVNAKGQFYAGGEFHAPELSRDEGDAIVFTGGKLLDMAGWQGDKLLQTWRATKIFVHPKATRASLAAKTLDDWVKEYGVVPQAKLDSMAVPISVGQPGYRELWALQDYRVSSVVAGTVWLMPKN